MAEGRALECAAVEMQARRVAEELRDSWPHHAAGAAIFLIHTSIACAAAAADGAAAAVSYTHLTLPTSDLV